MTKSSPEPLWRDALLQRSKKKNKTHSYNTAATSKMINLAECRNYGQRIYCWTATLADSLLTSRSLAHALANKTSRSWMKWDGILIAFHMGLPRRPSWKSLWLCMLVKYEQDVPMKALQKHLANKKLITRTKSCINMLMTMSQMRQVLNCV